MNKKNAELLNAVVSDLDKVLNLAQDLEYELGIDKANDFVSTAIAKMTDAKYALNKISAKDKTEGQ